MNALLTLPPDIARRRVIGTEAAAAFCGVSVSTFRRLRESGSIPAPIRLSQRKLGWRIGDLSDFIDSHASVAGNDNMPDDLWVPAYAAQRSSVASASARLTRAL